jgi:hypothetical protein
MSPSLLTLTGTLFAFLAAGFWLWSAATRFPPPRGSHETILEDMQLRSQALRLQSRRNACAAICAACAAIFQALGILATMG